MLRILFSFTPCMVCAFWCIIFALNFHKSDKPKQWLTLFLAVCTVLYFCHGLYFTIGLSSQMEALWSLCSLSVYPLYYIYICLLTSTRLSFLRKVIIIAPIVLVVLAKFFFPGHESDTARQILFTVQVLCVVYFGYKRLQDFDRKLMEIYADMEGRDTTAVKHLLAAFLVTSLCSAAANAIGKHFFAQSEWLILLVLMPFTIMLFMLSYIGFTRKFTVEQYLIDSADTFELPMELTKLEEDQIGKDLLRVLTTERYFLKQNLKISDITKKTGICRTYLSNYINNVYGCSFSDYVNRMRVAHAKRLIQEAPNTKLMLVADLSGFTSEQSFYRNFRKFTGMKPSEWTAECKQKLADSLEK